MHGILMSSHDSRKVFVRKLAEGHRGWNSGALSAERINAVAEHLPRRCGFVARLSQAQAVFPAGTFGRANSHFLGFAGDAILVQKDERAPCWSAYVKVKIPAVTVSTGLNFL